MNKAGELGLIGTAVPEEYGGMGQDVITGTIIAEEIGRTGSFAATVICHVGIGTLPILYFGTEEQKTKYLPNLASGKLASILLPYRTRFWFRCVRCKNNCHLIG
ncbi:MAG: acyl-CoA dehydrogenase family protein [Bacteroidetes bacterium]|nr:acyl-CoA dehydrogenase family protein [Bacteroidota bacterium]